MQYCNSVLLMRDNIKEHEETVHLLQWARTRKDVTLYSTNEIVLSFSKLFYVLNRYFSHWETDNE